ncbi:MAG: M16 family metallopeptidase, partial [Opitutaceae bacterium]
VLENGLRYVILANGEPKARVSARLLIEAGAVHEADDQQGLAHFLEHMAFNGSVHYPPGTLVEFFQRMGMSFGGDTNASTSYHRTLYLLELPDAKAATLDEAVKVFGDYASGLLLRTDEIDRERGIILSEKRTRDSVGYRTSRAIQGFLLEGTVLAKRDIIGTEEVLKTANRERFVDFYEAWYRPELMAVVLVGDFDADDAERRLRSAFSDIRSRGERRPAPDWGKVPSFEGVRAFHHHEKEASGTMVTIATIAPYAKEPDNGANRLKYLPRSLAHAILNRRLAVLARRENAPFISGSAGVGESLGFYRQAAISLNCRAEQWSEALGLAEQELRRALEHGFQPVELAEVVANFRTSLEQAVKSAKTRRSPDLADEIAESLLERDVWTSAEDDLALYGPALARVSVEECLQAMRAAWAAAHRLVMVTGNVELGTASDAAKTIKAAFAASASRSVEAPERIAEQVWGYTDFGQPGRVVRREKVQDLDVTLVEFANGVRLNVKRTDFEANRVRVSARIGHGQLTEPADQPGLAAYAGRTFIEGGLGRHSVDELRRILAGRTVGVGFGTAGDAFTLGGGCSREDFLLQMQLMAARATDPGYRPEAARQAAKWIDQMYRSFEHTASGPFSLEVARIVAGGDPRFGLPSRAEMERRNLAEVKVWLEEDLKRGPVEIAVAGDIEPEEVINAVARTFGALPARGPRKSLEELRRVRFPAEPFQREFLIASEIPKAELALYWPTTDGTDIRLARRLNLLAEVLGDRLRVKVREELGDAYSPGVGSIAGDVFPGFGYIQAGITVDPAKTSLILGVVGKVAAELAAQGVNEDELKRAKEPVLTSLRDSARTNGYWVGSVLAKAQEKPEVLAWCRSRYADNDSITREEISDLARNYFASGRVSSVAVKPAAK